MSLGGDKEMQFVSIYFFVFLFAAILGYYCCPSKYRFIFIFFSNIIFYISWIDSFKDFVPLSIVILITWWGGVLLVKIKSKVLLTLVVIMSVFSLICFKYFDFFIGNINIVSNTLDGKEITPINLINPMGISFFTFQAIGYVIDVYRGKVKPEKNIIRYAAFVSFFATITSGPIERSDELLKQIQKSDSKLSYYNLSRGLIFFVWGAFIKLVISNRISVIVDTVFDSYYFYGGAVLAIVSMCYAFQIYCDFLSYSLLSMGIAKCFDYNILKNFKNPYFSETVQDFWRRWHISLSTWFRDYVYISMGGNRCSKFRKNLNLFITFIISGIWHGANWTFIFWGCLHGLYQIIGDLTKPIRDMLVEKLEIKTCCFSFHLWRKMYIFFIVSFAWILFRSETVSDAFNYIIIMFTDIQFWQLFDGTIYSLGLNNLQLNILIIAFVLFEIVDYREYKTNINIDELLVEQNALFQCIVIAGLIVVTFMFGVYGPEFNAQDFIYTQF